MNMKKEGKNGIYLALIMVAWTMLLLITACGEKAPVTAGSSEMENRLDEAARKRDFDKMLILIDSMEAKGDMTELYASLRRGWVYHKMRQYSKAEEYYNKVLNADIRTAEDLETYQDAAGYLADLLYIKHDYEGALQVAVPVVQRMERDGVSSPDALITLLISVGRCQMKLGRQQEASETFNKVYGQNLQAIAADSTGSKVRNAVVHTANIAIRYLNVKDFDDAQLWLERTEEFLKQYAALYENKQVPFVMEYEARLNIYKAYTLQSMGRSEEAAANYDAFMTSDYAHKDDGRLDACEYLMAAQRYEEAADNLEQLDRMMAERGYRQSLDNIQGYLLPKYRANVGAGRKDSAQVVAAQICEALDSAIVWQKDDDAAELATIYDTQQKEMTIARQKADISRAHTIAFAIALGLISVFFVFYALYRRNTMRRLAEKNRQLKVANARAEGSSKMKTDFIRQISHEIRTPLNILSGFTQIITAPDMNLDETTRQDINRQITENADRITQLVYKMLEMSDANSMTVIERNDDVSALQIATQAASDANVIEAKHIRFVMDTTSDAENVMLHTNQRQATRALTLLLDNARKFTKGGRVSLHVTKQQSHVLFTIEDTGIGVPAQEAEHIFDEFVQLDNNYEGTGLGLTVARSIARRLGGDILLDTAYTAGARFVMTLPIDKQMD